MDNNSNNNSNNSNNHNNSNSSNSQLQQNLTLPSFKLILLPFYFSVQLNSKLINFRSHPTPQIVDFCSPTQTRHTSSTPHTLTPAQTTVLTQIHSHRSHSTQLDRITRIATIITLTSTTLSQLQGIKPPILRMLSIKLTNNSISNSNSNQLHLIPTRISSNSSNNSSSNLSIKMELCLDFLIPVTAIALHHSRMV